ncbi:MAG: chalcone isomerase family protein, partial [Calditerrivibrio sp.]|nr:chalcone isomerase family protein [Calditerrivibrio sp.]
MKKIIIYLIFMLTLMPNFLHAVNLPDNIEIKSQPLLLNGSGIRKKMFFSIYECGLYLPNKTTKYEDVIKSDRKLIKLSFIYKKLSPDKIKEAFKEGIDANYKNRID